MDKATQRDLARLRAERELVARQLDHIDLQMGRRADEILTSEQYASKSSIGRILGFSHTHIGTLIDRARQAPEPERRGERVPEMDNTIAGDYVLSIGARVVRSVSAFGDDDVLMQTGLDPRLFVEEGYQRPLVPHMLWQLDTGDWVGVGTASVGYGGSGCDLAVQALTRAGVPAETADEIVRYRFCDAVDINDRDTWTTSTVWPVHSRRTPSVIDDRMVVLFGDGLARSRTYDSLRVRSEAVDPTGFYPSETEETNLEAWLRFLNDVENLPEWAQGPRVARVFRSAEAAAEDGFIATSSPVGWSSRSEHPCIVIEQGKVQLWGFYYRPRDATQYLPDEAYQVLALADVYPEALRDRDERAARPWSRFVASFIAQRDGLPDRIDISAAGNDALTYRPTEPVRFMG